MSLATLFKPKSFDGSQLEASIARAQTFMLLGIGIQWIGAMLEIYWVMLFGFVAVIFFGGRLAASSAHNWTLLLLVGLFIPLLQWGGAYAVNEFATAFLRARKIKVGLLGAYYPTWVAAAGLAAVMGVAYGLDRGLHVMGHTFWFQA